MMKKILMMICVCAVCVMLPVMALAITQTEWNQECKLKIGSAVTIYSVSRDDSENGVLATGTDIDMWESGTLAAGTYIKQNSYDSQLKMWEISYFKGGSVASAFIRDGSKIVSALATVRIYDGKGYESVQVPEALIGDGSALCRYLASLYPGYTFTMMDDDYTVFKERKAGSSSGNDDDNSWKDLQQQAKDAASSLRVNLDELPKALVYAPRTGKASLRRTAAGNGKVIDKYIDGTVVYVVSEGSKFTQVIVGDKTGYIINSALEFLDPDERPLGEGVLSYKGKSNGRTKINMRSDPGSKGRKIETWYTGTEVIVWSVSEDGNWYEVEYQDATRDVRLYVAAEFLTITELYNYDEEDEAEGETGDADAWGEESYGGDDDLYGEDEDWEEEVNFGGDGFDYYSSVEDE